MATGWQDDKRWSDRFLSEIKAILGVHLIGEPPIEEDAERNTDLMVLKMDAVRIACRVRRPGYSLAYAHDFTIRSSRPTGAKTELRKIIEGWGDYMLYGFSNDAETALAGWMLGDLKVFRAWYASELLRGDAGRRPGLLKSNRDGSSEFYVFDSRKMPRGFIVAKQGIVSEAAA